MIISQINVLGLWFGLFVGFLTTNFNKEVFEMRILLYFILFCLIIGCGGPPAKVEKGDGAYKPEPGYPGLNNTKDGY